MMMILRISEAEEKVPQKMALRREDYIHFML